MLINKTVLLNFSPLLFIVSIKYMPICSALSTSHQNDEALIDAVQNKDRQKSIALLNQGANPNVEFSYTAMDLDTPTQRHCPLLFKALGWSRVGGGCYTAMLQQTTRIISCDPIVVNAFLDSGANPNTGREKGDSILSFAVRQSPPEIVKLFLEHKANIRTLKETPFLIEAANNHRSETVKLLLSYGAKVNEQDRNGGTALMAAVHFAVREREIQAIDTVRILLKAGANRDLKDRYGKTALMLAVGHEQKKLLRLLVSNRVKK